MFVSEKLAASDLGTIVQDRQITQLFPFHLSLCASNLKDTRYFYKEVLGVEERRASKTSVHFNFFGSQLTFHEINGFRVDSLAREVDAEDVPVPHLGAALSYEAFDKIQARLTEQRVNFVLMPHLRFIGKGHEQHVLFLQDPSGYGIEIKSFTKVGKGEWA